MTTSQKKRVGIVLGCIVLALVAVAPTFFKKSLPDSWPTQAIKLGLDLRGGTYLVLGVKTEEAVKSRIRSIASELKAELRSEKIRILRGKQVSNRDIELTLINDSKALELDNYIRKEYPDFKKIEGRKSGTRFIVRYQISEAKAAEIKKISVEQAIETIRNRIDQTGLAEAAIQRSAAERIIVQLPDVTDIESVKRTIGSVAKLEFRFVVQPGEAISTSLPFRDGGRIEVEEDVMMTGDVIDRAYVDISPTTNEPEVALKLNSSGAKIFQRLTAENVGRRFAIILDGVVQSAPVIREAIPGGRASISGGFTPEESHFLALVLRAGALPAPLEFLEERTVGSTLGADSIRQGVTSLAVGSIIVVLFTIFYYKKAGLLAVSCLGVNLLFLLALFALLDATLTLPGLAGLVLTVGMAIDANIIIFERIREEIKAGSSASAAAEGGFLRAHWTIMDANITTLLTAMILYGFGSGPVKGFAVTLSLGILTSVFSALFVAKVGFEVLKLQNSKGKLSI